MRSDHPGEEAAAVLSRTLDASDADAIKSKVDPTSKRRMIDLGQPHMSLALYPAPAYLRAMAETGRSSQSLLSNSALYQTLRVRLGLQLLSTSAGKCTICGKEVATRSEPG